MQYLKLIILCENLILNFQAFFLTIISKTSDEINCPLAIQLLNKINMNISKQMYECIISRRLYNLEKWFM